MRNFLLFVILMIISGLSGKSQCIDTTAAGTAYETIRVPVDSVRLIYEQEAIYFDGYGNYIKNRTKYALGLFNKHLREELGKSDEAIAEYNQYRKLFAKGLILYLGCGAGTIILVAVTSSPVGFILFLPAFYSYTLVSDALTHYYRSIWIYNRDMLLKGLTQTRK